MTTATTVFKRSLPRPNEVWNDNKTGETCYILLVSNLCDDAMVLNEEPPPLVVTYASVLCREGKETVTWKSSPMRFFLESVISTDSNDSHATNFYQFTRDKKAPPNQELLHQALDGLPRL